MACGAGAQLASSGAGQQLLENVEGLLGPQETRFESRPKPFCNRTQQTSLKRARPVYRFIVVMSADQTR